MIAALLDQSQVSHSITLRPLRAVCCHRLASIFKAWRRFFISAVSVDAAVSNSKILAANVEFQTTAHLTYGGNDDKQLDFNSQQPQTCDSHESSQFLALPQCVPAVTGSFTLQKDESFETATCANRELASWVVHLQYLLDATTRQHSELLVINVNCKIKLLTFFLLVLVLALF